MNRVSNSIDDLVAKLSFPSIPVMLRAYLSLNFDIYSYCKYEDMMLVNKYPNNRVLICFFLIPTRGVHC